jgi:hypothetical protein
MPMLNVSVPPATAAVVPCPHCSGTARITLVEPHPREPQKEWHVFRCGACEATRAYLTSR